MCRRRAVVLAILPESSRALSSRCLSQGHVEGHSKMNKSNGHLKKLKRQIYIGEYPNKCSYMNSNNQTWRFNWRQASVIIMTVMSMKLSISISVFTNFKSTQEIHWKDKTCDNIEYLQAKLTHTWLVHWDGLENFSCHVVVKVCLKGFQHMPVQKCTRINRKWP